MTSEILSVFGVLVVSLSEHYVPGSFPSEYKASGVSTTLDVPAFRIRYKASAFITTLEPFYFAFDFQYLDLI